MRESEERKHISPSHSRPDEDAKANNQPTNFPRRRLLPRDSGQDAPGKLPSLLILIWHLGDCTLCSPSLLCTVYVPTHAACRLPPSSLFFHVLLIPLENVELCGNEIPFVDRGFEGGRERKRACAPGAKTGARACLPTHPTSSRSTLVGRSVVLMGFSRTGIPSPPEQESPFYSSLSAILQGGCVTSISYSYGPTRSSPMIQQNEGWRERRTRD